MNRFDVSYGPDGVRIDYHFCRGWDGEDGCYGTDPDHGFTFEEAKAHVIGYYENRIAYWKDLTEEAWTNP